MATLTEKGKLGKRLTLAQQHAVVSAVASGRSQSSVAKDAGLNPRTVQTLMNNARNEPETLAWRDRLNDTLPDKAVIALDRSVSDTNDIHKAASTGMGILKGLGILNGDTPGTVINVLTVVNQALPSDLQFDIVSTDEVIDAQATDSTEDIR